MVTFRNNNRRGRFRSNDRSFKRTGDGPNYKPDFHTNGDFQRKSFSRNNHNASKLVEKYNNLAREALANEDKILSESYFQHADHFMRVLNEQEQNRIVHVKNQTDSKTDKKNESFSKKDQEDKKKEESKQQIVNS
mgnify:CR=1 FL=1